MQHTYLAADSLKKLKNADLESPDSILDYVAHQTPLGLLSHSLTIKMNTVYHFMCNLWIDRDLVKNVCVVMVAVGNRLVTVQLLCGIGGVGVVDSNNILIS